MKNNQLIIAAVLVFLALISRIICAEMSAYNFAPVVAIGLVSGILVKDIRVALLLALSGQFLADVYFQIFPSASNYGFYGISQFFVYGGILSSALIGRLFTKMNGSAAIFGTVSASTAFFALSNLGYFFEGHNGYSIAGLGKTYIDAIPFFKNSLQADLIGSALLFSTYFAIKSITARNFKTA